ncbi:MAG: Mu-like prophage major head subunit gpT family protein [Candidatus Berkelbacteria bacterium]|nr:Mu-like prophage major head subunit gpT family protein [Candidatus Berkelbacteria bacterium]
MALVTTSSFAKALWPGVNAWYGKEYTEYSPEHTQLFDTFSSDRNFEEDVGVSSYGLFVQKPEGSAVTYDTERQAFTTRYTHIVYALGFMISREIYEDDMYDVVGQRKAQGLAFSSRQTKETIAANVYNRAFTSGYTGGDGSILCVSSHPNLAGGTWSNVPTAAVDLSEAALEQAVIDIAGFTNDRGLKIAVLPKRLVIPVNSWFDAARILKADKQPDTLNNNINAIKTLGLVPEMVVNHYLTDTDAWFLRTNVKHGMKHFERWPDRFEMDNDFDTENAKFKAVGRYSFGWTDPRQLYGSQGA